MRLVCVIDCLGAGGAQRQLTGLGVGLKRRGHQVEFLVYHQDDHFLPALERAGIPCEVVERPIWRRPFALRAALRRKRPEAVLAFLEGACAYAELAGIPRRSWGLVVGERRAEPRLQSGWRKWIRKLHALADYVVTNSHANRQLLVNCLPSLQGKTLTIYNIVDLDRFRPGKPGGGREAGRPLRLAVAASYQPTKNMEGVVRAVKVLQQRYTLVPLEICWFGNQRWGAEQLRSTRLLAETLGVSQYFQWNDAVQAIEEVYAVSDAAGLFSFYEGLPNAVCEAMACGLPILMSDVCDARHLVKPGVNGFLVYPASPDSIASGLEQLMQVDPITRRQMGAASRARAEQLFDPEQILQAYEQVLVAAMRRDSSLAVSGPLASERHGPSWR